VQVYAEAARVGARRSSSPMRSSVSRLRRENETTEAAIIGGLCFQVRVLGRGGSNADLPLLSATIRYSPHSDAFMASTADIDDRRRLCENCNE